MYTMKKRWYKSEKKVKWMIPLWYSIIRFVVEKDSLAIKDVTDGDEGTYTCIRNTTLDQDSASAMLTVVGTFTVDLTFNEFFALLQDAWRSGIVSIEIA